MKVVLFGSPAFAVDVLEALLEPDWLELAAVVTQPAKPVGRGLRLQQPPLAARALDLGLELQQPAGLRGNSGFRGWLEALAPDVAVTAAYGRILPADLLAVPAEGFLNVHASLLPRWRGAAPVQWSLISGDTETGVSIMQTEEGLDTGPVRLARTVPIGPAETAPELFRRLSALGAAAIIEALQLLREGRLPLQPQDDSLATYAPMLTHLDGLLDFSRPARESYDRFRGVAAWPGTFFRYGPDEVKVHDLEPVDGASGVPGEVLELGPDGLLVAAGAGGLLLRELQSPGRKRLPARDWANGAGVRTGSRLLPVEG